MPQEIPAVGCSGRIFLGEIQQHPGCSPVTCLAVNTAQETDNPSSELHILQTASGVEILPVAVSPLLFACEPGGEILG